MIVEHSPKPYSSDTQRYAQFSILHHPDLEYHKVIRNLEIAKLMEIPIVTVNWGNHETAGEFIARNRLDGLISESEIDMVHQSGFSGGWRNPPYTDTASDEYQETHAQIGAALVKRVLRERSWGGADLLVFGSISSNIDTPQRIADLLSQDGIRIDNTLFYGLACASTTAPLADINRMESLKNSRVVLVGLETLSGKQFDPKDIQTSWTFGNGGGALAWIAGKEIEHIAGQAWVEKDDGMITAPEHYTYGLSEEIIPRESWPYWYKFVNETSKDAFAFFHGGVVMSMPTKEGTAVTKMNGRKTFSFFARRVPAYMGEFFQSNEFRPLCTPIIHQPSKPVIDGIRKKYNELIQESAQSGIHLPALDIRWVMEPTGVNNVSAATALFALSQLTRLNLIRPETYTPLIGLGIGSTIHTDIIRFTRS